MKRFSFFSALLVVTFGCNLNHSTTNSTQASGECSMNIDGESISCKLFLSDTSLVLAIDNMDPCFMPYNPADNQTEYNFCGYSLNLKDSSTVELFKIEKSVMKDTLIAINPASGLEEMEVVESERLDTIGSCSINLKILN